MNGKDTRNGMLSQPIVKRDASESHTTKSLRGPRADRLELLRFTRTHFLLYS